jgi:hypothetical protein
VALLGTGAGVARLAHRPELAGVEASSRDHHRVHVAVVAMLVRDGEPLQAPPGLALELRQHVGRPGAQVELLAGVLRSGCAESVRR